MLKYERKLLKFWAQSFLLGVPTIIVGFRDQDGIVRSLEELANIRLMLSVLIAGRSVNVLCQGESGKHSCEERHGSCQDDAKRVMRDFGSIKCWKRRAMLCCAVRQGIALPSVYVSSSVSVEM